MGCSVLEGSKNSESNWLSKKGKTSTNKKPTINRTSKKIEKPPKKVPIKKLQLEEKKKNLKLKIAEKSKESTQKKRI